MRNYSVNPFYARSRRPSVSGSTQARYAKLPRAPRNASPVPHLTSLYHFEQTGEFGDRGYPGNCGGLLIRDLLTYFGPRSVLDPMTGSGTCAEVCRSLGVACVSRDIRGGFDACDPRSYAEFGAPKFDFVWLHPPYWRQKRYSDDPRDMSTQSLERFLGSYVRLIENCAALLASGGKLAILMGDYTDRQAGFVPLTYHTKRIAFDCGLRQSCTDIIRFSHGASSGTKVYRSAFIPGLHDVCMVFERR
jgi:hypothetical protein